MVNVCEMSASEPMEPIREKTIRLQKVLYALDEMSDTVLNQVRISNFVDRKEREVNCLEDCIDACLDTAFRIDETLHKIREAIG